jgi:hypothetical protein
MASNTPPSEYLPEVNDKFPDALSSQFIPMDPELWRIERYREFLEARRELIARKMNEFTNSLIEEPEETHRRPISDLISLGEGYNLEFKSTLQWDLVERSRSKALRFAVLKTIAAFMNSDGGTLVIGVEDDGTVCGLGNDLTLVDGSIDRFEQLLTTLVGEMMGHQLAPLYMVRFEPVDGKQVCAVDVERAPGPVFVKTERGKGFCVRVGNTTRFLDSESSHQYIETHWE